MAAVEPEHSKALAYGRREIGAKHSMCLWQPWNRSTAKRVAMADAKTVQIAARGKGHPHFSIDKEKATAKTVAFSMVSKSYQLDT